MKNLSKQDHAMIDVLKRSGRLSVTDLARELNVSRSTAQKRLERLEGSGVIESYSCVLSAAYRRQWVSAHVLVQIAVKQMDSVVSDLQHVKGVEEVLSVSGEFDLIVVISAPDVRTLESYIDSILAIGDVTRTTTSIVLSTRINRRV